MPGISIPIIDQLVHPSIGQLTRVAFPANPYSNLVTAVPPQNPLVALTYGVVMRINAVGAFHGRDVSFPIQYDPPLGKISTNFTDLGGNLVTQQLEYWTFDNQWYVWNEPLPGLWSLYLAPDVSANLYWLQT